MFKSWKALLDGYQFVWLRQFKFQTGAAVPPPENGLTYMHQVAVPCYQYMISDMLYPLICHLVFSFILQGDVSIAVTFKVFQHPEFRKLLWNILASPCHVIQLLGCT